MRIVLIVTAAILLTGCRKPASSIHVTESRRLTLHDRVYPGDYKDAPPIGWRRLPGTQFRLINYVAGENDSVEIVVGETQGDLLANANRWLGQFGLSPVQSLEFLGGTEMLGKKAYLVEGDGTYSPGMGKPPREDYAMIGVIRESSLNLITLKMTGPAQEVGKQREAFYEYMRGFEAIYDHKIDSSIEEVKIETGEGGE
ncbi:MAG: hypothetical protein ACR2QY_08170 [Akkermansiaceae bacterium]